MNGLTATLFKPSDSSYDLSSIAVDPTREVDRLNAQIDLFWLKERELYRQLGLPTAAAVLDCGCGSGCLLGKLREAFPGPQFHGIDVDASLVDIARRTVAACPDIEVKLGSITAIAFPDNSFDFIIARLVLEHLPEPPQALHEVFRVLKPGGTAVFIDNDFDFHERVSPDTPELAEFYDAYCRARRAQHGNPCIGRELPGLLKRAGFSSVDLHLLAAHNEVVGDAAFRRANGSGIPAQLVRQNFLPAASLDQIASQWRMLLANENHAIFRMLFAASGKKPDSPDASRAATTAKVVNPNGMTLGTAPLTDRSGSTASAVGIREWIRNRIAAEIGVLPDEIDFTQPLLRCGVDSIAATGLCEAIQATFGVQLPIAEVLGGASIDAIAEKLNGSVAV